MSLRKPSRRSPSTASSTSASSSSSSSRRKGNKAATENKNVLVCIRVRPMNRLETRTNQHETWSFPDSRSILQTWLPSDSKYSSRQASGSKAKAKDPISMAFDHVFPPTAKNAYVYTRIGRPIVHSAMQGFHGCIFAYGQTSSGKTYTIHGSGDAPGMIPLSVEDVFDFIEDNPERDFVLRVSYIEIYNEIVNDLLNPRNSNLRVREDRRKGVFIEGLKEEVVMAPDQVFSLLHMGTSHRHVGRTNYNDVSSRSHTIFRITIESSLVTDASDRVRTSTLNLVDLAGSENVVKAGSAARQKETGYINKSLLSLGHVIYKLSENKLEHIPYRDSKLTRILQQALSGKSLVSMCCNLSPSSGNLEESISTLKFANRAKRIKNSASVNEEINEKALLRQYRQEIDRLKRELDEARTQADELKSNAPAEEANNVEELLLQSEQEKEALRAKIETLTRLILHSSQADEEKAAASAASAAAAAAAPSKHRKAPSIRVPGEFGTKGPARFGTLPRNFRMPSTLRRRPSLHTLTEELPDIDTETGDQDADDLLCPSPNLSTFDTAQDDSSIPSSSLEVPPDANLVIKLKNQLREMTVKLRQVETNLINTRHENEALRAEVAEKDELLKEWDNYYVSSNNERTAITNEVRRVAQESDSTEPLSGLFSALGLEEEFDAPLIDVDEVSTLAPPGGLAADGSGIHTRATSKSFQAAINRWKAMSQDE
jgi:septal ring factor EnvC (AmiA/AmiB activator)